MDDNKKRHLNFATQLVKRIEKIEKEKSIKDKQKSENKDTKQNNK